MAQHHILFSSLFIRETIALVLAVGCLYLYFSARSSAHPATYYALSIISLAGTVLAHHLTGFMLLILLLIHVLVTKASELPFLRRTYFGDNIALIGSESGRMDEVAPEVKIHQSISADK